MSRAQGQAEVVDAQPARGPDLHAVPTYALERELTERYRAAQDIGDRSLTGLRHEPSTDRLFIDEPDRP